MPKESVFKKRVMKDLKALEPELVARSINQIAVNGTEDVNICCAGNFVAWELKNEQGQPTPLQEYNLEKIRKAGGIGEIVRPSNYPEQLARLKRLQKGGKYHD